MTVFAALLAAAAGLLVPSAPAAEERRAGASRLMNELMTGKAVGQPFALTDARGKKTALAHFRGKLVLLYFGFLSCPDICPTDLMVISQAIKSLGAEGERLQPLFITLDPLRDKPEALGAYAGGFHPRFVALTGSEAQIRQVASDYKVFFEKVPVPGTGSYTIDHAAFTFLLDRNGRYIGLFPPGTSAERMAAILREQLRAL